MANSASLTRALDILTVLAGRTDGATIAEVVEILGQPRSNVVRIVNTLVEYGLIARKSRRLVPTRAFYDLCIQDRYSHLRAKYRAVLRHLSEKLNELVLLGVHEGNGIIHIDFIESDHRVRVAPSPVTRHELSRNAIGKIALARRPDLLAAEANPELEREIAMVRRNGIAWNREETTEGVIVIACPGYTNATTEPIIAVGWPVNRYTEDKAKAAQQLIRKTLEAIPAKPSSPLKTGSP